MPLLTLGLFVVGLLLLLAGAEIVVRAAVGIARRLGISALVVGLTVVALGTSAPELAVSVRSALDGQAGLALGNAVGSNIFNVLVILGLSALVTPLFVSRQLVRIDVPVMIGVSLLVWAVAFDGRITRSEGAFLLAGLVLYTLVLIRLGRRSGRFGSRGSESLEEDVSVPAPPAPREPSGFRTSFPFRLLQMGVGIGLLILGSRWLVDGALAAAGALGVSELVVGLTVVAAGTSLPEAATSVLASVRGQRDIAVGNVVGSNVFNLLGAVGLAGLVSPAGAAVPTAALAFDLPVMTVVAVACLPVFFTGYVIARWEGLVFLLYYGAYAGYLFLASAQHDALPLFSGIMLLFVLPLTVLTFGLVVLREVVGRRAGAPEAEGPGEEAV